MYPLTRKKGSSAELSPSCVISFTLTYESVVTELGGFATLKGIDGNLNAVDVNGPGSITNSEVGEAGKLCS